MVQFIAFELVDALNWLSSESDGAYILQDKQLDDASADDKARLLFVLEKADQVCVRLELVKVRGMVDTLLRQLKEGKKLNYSVIDHQCQALRHTIAEEIKERSFAFIPQSKVAFFEQDRLFGEAVHQKFLEAAVHIKSAGNCLAADLPTAAVFHLMSVAEIGLRAIARKLGVKTVKKDTPLELGTWEDVIKALETKVNGIFPRSKKGQQESDFYKGVFIEYRAFKDFWRNKVMHTRIEYDEHAAQSAFEHVRAFMQRLAEKV